MARRGMATAPCLRAAPVPPPRPSAPSGLRRPCPPPHTPPHADDPILSIVPVPVANRILPPVCSLKDPPFASLKNTAVRFFINELLSRKYSRRSMLRFPYGSGSPHFPRVQTATDTVGFPKGVPPVELPHISLSLGNFFRKNCVPTGSRSPTHICNCCCFRFFYILFNSTLVWILFF